jgi:hypothetical protein
MGNPLFPILANIFMSFFEKELQLFPRIWIRYVLKKLIQRKASFEKIYERIEDQEDQPFEVRRSTRQCKQPDWLKINKL